jgi:hypothetical protein
MTVAKEDVVSFIDNMTVLEMSQFVKELEEKYGVTAAAPSVAVAAAPGAGAAAAEEKTEFNVVLTAAGEKKILPQSWSLDLEKQTTFAKSTLLVKANPQAPEPLPRKPFSPQPYHKEL